MIKASEGVRAGKVVRLERGESFVEFVFSRDGKSATIKNSLMQTGGMSAKDADRRIETLKSRAGGWVEVDAA